MTVEEGISEEHSDETWLSEMNIEKAIEETILESNGIAETMQEAIEEHRAGVEDAMQEASVPFRQGSMTSGQQALHAARQCMQSSDTEAEICQVICTLAIALGASRPEAGTIKALRAVLMLLERPEMLSEEQACTSTGASFSNFKRWRKRVQSAQLGMSLP